MKPARELVKSGRVSETKYEAPLLSGYVREGAKKGQRWVLSGATRVSENFLFFGAPEVQRNQTRRFFELSAMNVKSVLLLVIPLLLLSGSFVGAGPVGDFFNKIGQSISKRSQPEPPPPPPQLQPQSMRPQPANTSHGTRRRTSRAAPTAATATPPAAIGQPSQPPKEELTSSKRRVSAADIEKAKAGLPYGIPVPGRKGMVTSPYLPEDDKYIDVTDFASGSVVKDPYTEKFFLVP